MRIQKSLVRRPYIENKQLREEFRKYFLAFEGTKTEPQYFEGIIKYSDRLGINATFQIIPLNRPCHKAGNSNPLHGCLHPLLQSLNEYRLGEMSISSLVDHAIDWAAENGQIKRKGNENNLKSIHKCLVASLIARGYAEYQSIPGNELDNVAETVLIELEKILHMQYQKKQIKSFLNEIHLQCETYSKDDKACMIIDRDKESFTKFQYDIVVSECGNNNIELYVSNPCFEFWLLLHFTDGKNLNPLLLLNDNTYLKTELKKYLPHYSKCHIEFDELLPNIEKAVQNEKQYCENLDGLKEKLGTNIGCLITELMRK